jgi:hypothetical protein
MVRCVKRAAITCKLLHEIVDGLGEIVVRHTGLLVEDQVMPEASKLLNICSDGNSVGFLAVPLHPLR